MNLYASRKMAEIIASIAEQVAVSIYVKNEEALFVYQKSKRETPQERNAVDLSALIDQNLITVVHYESEAEKITFANLTSHRLDDGEAATGAIAIHRNWALATDDRRTQRYFAQHFSHIQLISTPQLLKHWSDSVAPDTQVISEALIAIETRANYWVSQRNTLYRWWQSKKSS